MIRTTFLFCLIIVVVYFANQGDVVSTVDTVDIEGEFNLSDEKLITERAKLFIGKNIYNIDLRHYKNEFEKIPWIKYSQISINPPSNLTVKIIEHNPMFLWNEQIYVNSEMQTFTTPNLPIKNILRLASNNYSYEEMYNLFKSVQSFLLDINETIIALSKQDDMLEIKSENLTFIVRHSRYPEKIREFVSIYPDFESKLNKRKKIHIDLRYPTGFAVR
tara:strand:+ start:5196 stop:5849 length:654 start_codon:yes stop_codon:yes gene_type:complete